MHTVFTTLKNFWKIIDQLNPQIKTWLILSLCVVFLIFYTKNMNESILETHLEILESREYNADKYTMQIAPKIHQCVQSIQKDDLDCFNVLLLSYHNSKKSLQGIRYLYLNCIIESPKGINDEQLKQYWTELEYIYYQDELSKIHNQGYLRIENIEDIKLKFPRLYKKLLVSDAKSAAFYPIEGVDSPIGMILVLYKNTKKYDLGYYNSYISPQIQRLSTLLDYPNIKYK